MGTKKLYKIIGQSGHFYSDQFGYIKNDGRYYEETISFNKRNNISLYEEKISFKYSLYRTIKVQEYRNGRHEYVKDERRKNAKGSRKRRR